MMNLVKLKDLFYIEYGNQLDLNKLEIVSDEEGINFVSRQSSNLGVQCKVRRNSKFKLYEKGSITVTLGGTYLLSAFVQQGYFYTAQNVKVLQPKTELTEIEKCFYCYVITNNRFRYTSHGREANKTLDDLLVPSLNSIPKWVYNQHCLKKPDDKKFYDKRIRLDDRTWNYFEVNSLFNISGTKTTKLDVLKKVGKGKYPYITTKAKNNGCEGFYLTRTESGNVITIDSAAVGYASYQAADFSASDHVEKLTLKGDLNKYIAMFLTTILNKEQYRFHYGRKASQDRLEYLKIKLPTTTQGFPDWEYMENYIKSLPYSSSL